MIVHIDKRDRDTIGVLSLCPDNMHKRDTRETLSLLVSLDLFRSIFEVLRSTKFWIVCTKGTGTPLSYVPVSLEKLCRLNKKSIAQNPIWLVFERNFAKKVDLLLKNTRGTGTGTDHIYKYICPYAGTCHQEQGGCW